LSDLFVCGSCFNRSSVLARNQQMHFMHSNSVSAHDLVRVSCH
jgi:hypothetical protein